MQYLFYISIIFVSFSFAHLIYTYFYHDSKLIPIKWGNISEWIIGEYPSLNPLLADNGNNAYLIHLLYRSLLQYDTTTSKISADLMSCDISNLLRVECYLENNIKWSDGAAITAEDIMATYKILQNSNINPVMSSLLANTEINQTDASIIFTNPSKDINFLNIFFQPILPIWVINKLSESELKGKFSADTSVYSGKFKLGSIHSDTSIGVTKFFLEKNDQYNGKEIFIQQLIIRLFPTSTELLRNKESVHIVNDRNNVLANSIPRLKSYPYTLNQYVWVFLNKETISDTSMRAFILNNIKRENLITILGKDNFKEIYNPYLTEASIDTTPSNKNIDDIIRALWYKRKSEVLEEFIVSEKKRQNYSWEVVLATIEQEEKIYTLEDFQAKSKTLFAPSYIEKYNYITNPAITLKWNVAEDVTAVYINDYKLTGYTPGSKQFAYTLQNVLKTWVNVYNIYFEIENEKQLQEEVTFIYNSDKAELEKTLAELIKKLWDEKDIEIAKIAQANRASAKPFELDPEKRAQIEALDDESFYNETLEKFGFTLFYTDTSDYITDTASYIQTSLEEKWIHITLEPITLAGLPQLLKEKDQYDIILAGINTGYFDFNIFPYFHSSQAEQGYNFSGTKKLSIDILLEELKSSLLGTKKITQLQEKVLAGLKEEQVVKTLYTPVLNNLVDKNINNYKAIEHIPNNHLRIDAIWEIYINEKKIIDFGKKSFGGFFSFLIDILNG